MRMLDGIGLGWDGIKVGVPFEEKRGLLERECTIYASLVLLCISCYLNDKVGIECTLSTCSCGA